MLLGLSQSAAAEVRLARLFSDHAVLQRNQPVRIFGFAKPGEKVTVHFHDQTADATTDKYGWWETMLAPEKAGGPYTLTVSGDATAKPVERTDILVGDVWFASGQSNMEMPLGGFMNRKPQLPIKDSEKEIAAATHPEIRLFLQKRSTSSYPEYDANGEWTLCTPETAKDFSAAAYFFGRDIQQHEHVPIGLIDSTWGGMPTQAFSNPAALAKAGLTDVLLDQSRLAEAQAKAAMLREQRRYEATAAGKETKPERPVADTWIVGSLYNGMVAPFTHYTIKGALWYQGEADRTEPRTSNYRRAFPAMIQDWRAEWNEGDFPFLFVQLPSFDFDNDKWPTVRDAQRRALALPNTAMAVTLDTGEAKNIHPPDKLTVGTRLALAAREIAYGEKIESASPTFVNATADGNAMRVHLSHADALMQKGDATASGFEIAGADKVFHPAAVTVQKDGTVLVSSPEVTAPMYVRYGWRGWVTTFYYNKTGLPLGTFTSEP
ncbi:MAG: sialate O-acetylesterase [Acidobacteria bacterium]|nr:sialate O-acetylesterase [Acidobacteriota bacterium]